MISVSIWRKTLEKLEACKEDLALYDAIAALLPETDARRDRRIRVANWTPLHSIWPYAAGYGALARWLEDRGVIPRANLSGAYRGSSSSSIPGWRTLATGYLERDGASSEAEQ